MKSTNFFVALSAALALSACATRVNPTAGAAPAPGPSTPTVATLAPPQSVAGTILMATRAHAGAQTVASLCEVWPSDVRVIRFEANRFLVQLAASESCGARFPNREAWLDASKVEVADAAYAPALARVRDQRGLRIDMAYAGNKIFCDDKQVCRINEPLYANARCYAAPQVADALARAAAALAARDATAKLVILDCYRPIYVQERMFSLVNDPVWVAQPKGPRYGGHNRAVAIDLTIEKNGVLLDMGSPFDAFDDRSEHNSPKVSDAARANRAMLRELMIGNGFRPYDAEWWHFSLPIETPALNYPL